MSPRAKRLRRALELDLPRGGIPANGPPGRPSPRSSSAGKTPLGKDAQPLLLTQQQEVTKAIFQLMHGLAQVLASIIQSGFVGRVPPETGGGQEENLSTHRRLVPLTHREEEVARLITRGFPNRKIGAELTISEGTAESHVQHILNKLGFHSRAQIAAWVVEHKNADPP